MNRFDRTPTTLGIVKGLHVLRRLEPELILSAGFGATLAMPISGA